MGQPFIPERVKAVDEVAGNVLIRGPMPLAGESWHYAYDEIAKASGVDLESMDFSVISLVDCTGERQVLEAEFQAFGHDAPLPSYWPPFERPDYKPWQPFSGVLETDGPVIQANLFWWPIEGLPDGVDPSQFLSAPGWDLSGLVELVYGLMVQRRARPLALYVHCTLGADRTGAVHSCYLVRKGEAEAGAFAAADSSTTAGPPAPDYQRLRSAYAALRRSEA